MLTDPYGAKARALEGANTYFPVPKDKPKVCVRIDGEDVKMTRIHFIAGGVDAVNVKLYKPDGETPIVGQVRYGFSGQLHVKASYILIGQIS